MGRYSEALDHFHECISCLEKKLGVNHPYYSKIKEVIDRITSKIK